MKGVSGLGKTALLIGPERLEIGLFLGVLFATAQDEC